MLTEIENKKLLLINTVALVALACFVFVIEAGRMFGFAATTVGNDISTSGVVSSTLRVSAPLYTSSSSIVMKPGLDSTTGMVVKNTSDTTVFGVDTVNRRVGINSLSPSSALEVTGNVRSTGCTATRALTQKLTGTVDYNDNDVIDTNTSVIVGNSGTIQKTTNGGTSWTAQTSGTAQQLNGVFFLNANTGFVTGNAGVILKTADGGTSWTAKTSGTANNLNEVEFVDTNTGFAVGASGTILKSTDGGETWAAQTSGTASGIIDLDAVNTLTVFAAMSTGNILKTVNGGTSWSEVTVNASDTIFSVRAITEQTVIAGGTDKIYRSTNGGTSWTTITVTTPASGTRIRALDFSDTLNGWAVGDNGVLLRTVDGGSNWVAQNRFNAEIITGVKSLTDATVFFATHTNGSNAGKSFRDDVSSPSGQLCADVAELYSYSGELPAPGSLVRVTGNGITVTMSDRANDSRVIGVVSHSPAVLIEGSAVVTGNPETLESDKVPVALAGRVLVNATSENGAIQPGDYLASSSRKGVAMKATKNGTTTVGKALTPLLRDTGKIWMLVDPGQFIAP